MAVMVSGNSSFQYDDIYRQLSGIGAFTSEKNLITTVIQQIHKFIQGDNIITSTELPVGGGIVDIVAGEFNKPINTPKHTSVSDIEAYVLSKLHFRQRLTVQAITRRTLLTTLEVSDTLIKLSDKGYCELSSNCYLRSQSVVHALTAIEGKIKDWKRALAQAHRNRLFTSQTFVALDAKYSRPALQNIDMFKTARVGLAIVCSNGEVYVVYKPPKSHPLAPVLPIIAESALLERIA